MSNLSQGKVLISKMEENVKLPFVIPDDDFLVKEETYFSVRVSSIKYKFFYLAGTK